MEVNNRSFEGHVDPDAKGTVVHLLWKVVSAIFFVQPVPVPYKVKAVLLSLFGAKVGKRVAVAQGARIKYPWRFEVGDDTWIGENARIENWVTVRLGSSVTLSQEAMLMTGNHDYKCPRFSLLLKSVEVEGGAWIGARGIVCPGVTCRSHSVLSVGSVATKDLQPYTIYQGNPAEPRRSREIRPHKDRNDHDRGHRRNDEEEGGIEHVA